MVRELFIITSASEVRRSSACKSCRLSKGFDSLHFLKFGLNLLFADERVILWLQDVLFHVIVKQFASDVAMEVNWELSWR